MQKNLKKLLLTIKNWVLKQIEDVLYILLIYINAIIRKLAGLLRNAIKDKR